MSINMITPVTAETINNLAPNAGMLLKNFDYSSATDAQSLAALLTSEETQKNSRMGATKGGINVQENRSFWTPTYDGRRMPFVGEKQFDTADPKITGTFVEYTPENVRAVSGMADVTAADGNLVTTVQPRATIKAGDYFNNIVWITNHGMDGLYLVEVKNALCTVGMNSQSTDKDIGTLPFEFSAHADSVVFTDELPIKYLFFGAASVTPNNAEATVTPNNEEADE